MSSVSTELDPFFMKALRYFRSKSPDSTAKLQKMLDDAIEQSQKKKQDIKPAFDKTTTAKTQKHSVKAGKGGLVHESKKKEKEIAQKRQFEKIQKDLEELDQEVSKKLRFDRASSPASAFLSGDVKPSPKQTALSNELHAQSRGSPLSSSEDKDFALEMDALACVVCNVVSSSQGNTPVECQECHNMYHRECHLPPISYQDANDPRCLWYCARCKKDMKKVAKQSSSKAASAVSNIHARERLNSMESKNKSAFVTPFKRNEMKPTLQSAGSGLGSGGSLSGWAALSGKNIHPTPGASSKTPVAKTSSFGQQKPAPSSSVQSKEKKDKANKVPKPGPKLAVSDAWAEALGADLPAAPSGGGKASTKSGTKASPVWGSSKSSVFPKAAATSVPSSSSSNKTGMTTEANAIKKLQMLKKKAKLNPKKSKI